MPGEGLGGVPGEGEEVDGDGVVVLVHCRASQECGGRGQLWQGACVGGPVPAPLLPGRAAGEVQGQEAEGFDGARAAKVAACGGRGGSVGHSSVALL